MTASAEAAIARPGEPVAITVTAENVGDARAAWGRGSSTCQLGLLVRVDGQDFPAPRIGGVCTADSRTHSLGPDESRTEVLAWDGLIQRGTGSESIERLGPGSYEVRGAAGRTAMSTPIMITLNLPQ